MTRIKRSKASATGKNTTPTKHEDMTSETVDPFQPVSDELQKFSSALDSDKIYVLHVDRTPTDLKRRVFMVPVWMNILFTVGLLIRLYYAIPFYCSFIISYFGRQGDDPWIQADRLPWMDFMALVSSRLAIVGFDMFLSTKVISWPVEFCFGAPASPLKWRTSVGFQDQEAIVRKSREFHADLNSPWTVDDLLTVKIFATEALNIQAIQKTAYTMIADKRWDLDFASMIRAHEFTVKSKDFRMAELDRVVLAYSPQTRQWRIWHLDGRPQQTPVTSGDHPNEDHVVRLAKYLRERRKGALFYRYIELVQYETSLPDANTPQRRQAMLRQIKDEFAKAQLDFGRVVRDVGGYQNMPGLEDVHSY
ncbi:MAG: hypothetical protein Q9160_007446 [Pyrenula sp. 1 TL-2023]